MTQQIFFAALATWASLAVAAAFIGAMGGAYLSERIGSYATHVVDVLLMIAATYGLTYLFVDGYEIVDVQLLLGIGISWSILAIGLELLVGRAVFGEPWARLGRAYNIKKGQLYSMVILALLISPYVASLHAAALRP